MGSAQMYKLGDVTKKFTRDNIEEIYFDRIKTGFDNLDYILGGGLAPGLTVLGAISNLGKSTFVLQLAQNVAKSGTPVLFFSMEMPASRIASKAISRQMFLQHGKVEKNCAITSNNLLTKEYMDRLSKEQWEKVEIARACIEKETENLCIIEGGEGMSSAKDIYNFVKNYVTAQWEDGKKVKPLVIIDYLQILTSDVTGGRRFEVDDNVRILKQLTSMRMDYEDVATGEGSGLAVIAISSIGRSFYDKKMSLDAFKESGNIEYSADVVLGMELANATDQASMNVEKSKFVRKVNIIPLKQRYGMCGSAACFNYYAKYDCFMDPAIPFDNGDENDGFDEENVVCEVQPEKALPKHNRMKLPKMI